MMIVAMNEPKKTLTKHINFRMAEESYTNLMKYLNDTKDTISGIMRQMTYDFLKAKEENEKLISD